MNDIKNITTPLLTSAQYGKDVNDVFENINDNFKILGNKDFVKGDKGDSIITKTVEVSQFPDIKNALKNAVKKQYINDINQPKAINGVEVLSWFDNPGNITLIYENIDGEDVLKSSMAYVFRDLRFSNIQEAFIKEYEGETDYSCIIYFNQGEFEAIQEFPTIYYDNDNQLFSWKINGVKTGLEAQGPRGYAGRNGVFKIVFAEKDPVESDYYEITKIMVGSELKEVANMQDQANICKEYGVEPGIPVMVLRSVGNGNAAVNYTYIGEVFEYGATNTTDTILYVRCNESNRVCQVEPIRDIESILNKWWINSGYKQPKN